MKKNLSFLILAVLGLAIIGGMLFALKQQSRQGEVAYDPKIDPKEFVANVDNPYFSLQPGKKLVYEGKTDGLQERNEFEVLVETKEILGVTCVVVKDTVWINGELEEQTYDWYAQDQEGNVWYFGEDSKEYKDGEVTSTAGSWEAGVKGAKPGILMKADPQVGESWRQEYFKGEAEDMVDVLAVDITAAVKGGEFSGCVKTKDYTPLEPGVAEEKTYCQGNVVFVEVVEGGEGYSELVSVSGI